MLDFFAEKNEREQEDLKRMGFVTTAYRTILKHDLKIPLENFLEYQPKDRDRFEKVEAFMKELGADEVKRVAEY